MEDGLRSPKAYNGADFGYCSRVPPTLQGFRFIHTPLSIIVSFRTLLQTWSPWMLTGDILGDDKAKRLRREVHFPSGKFGEAIQQAQAAVFLASDESSFVNATDFVVDGGLTKAYVTPEGPPTVAPKNNGR